jgi:hypothetical protein
MKNGAATASRSKNTKLKRVIRDLFIESSYVRKLAWMNPNVAKAGGEKRWRKTAPILECTVGLFQKSGLYLS